MLNRAGACDVLLSHTSPLGHCDLQRDGFYEGSEAVMKFSPALCLCGHIHNARGRVNVLGQARQVLLQAPVGLKVCVVNHRARKAWAVRVAENM